MNKNIFFLRPPATNKSTVFAMETLAVFSALRKTAALSAAVFHEGWGKTSSEESTTGEKTWVGWVKKQLFLQMIGPLLVKKSRATLLIHFGENTFRGAEIPQLFPRFSPVKNTSLPGFSPNPSLSGQMPVVRWLPLFPHPQAKPLSWEEREAIKEEVSGGKEFFFTELDAHTETTLKQFLKAFTLFKQRQRTNMTWLFTGSEPALLKFRQLIRDYKLRNEILAVSLPHYPQLLEWMAAAYALVHIPTRKSWQLSVYNAMFAQVPVITSHELKEITGEQAALFTDASTNQLADALKYIYKDENGRSAVVKKAAEKANLYTPEQTAMLIRSWA